jgi:SAM-dependent methyltransferase
VYYQRCPNCGHIEAPQFRRWSAERFISEIYNAEYISLDPDFQRRRPLSNAEFLHRTFGVHAKRLRHLDYGGGNGALSEELRKREWDSVSYDPFVDNAPPNGELCFDLVTAFEVFEHVPDPNQLMRSIVELMSERGVLIFSTLLSDAHVVPGERLTWWYAAPRNGHVSLYSRKSLSHLAGNFGMRLHSWNDGLHCMYRWLPDWVQTVIRPCGI